MDQMAIIRRSWEILRRYRVLWLFGVIVALTSGGGGGNGNGVSAMANGNRGGVTPFGNWNWLNDSLRPERWGGIIVFCCCLLVLLGIGLLILQYVSRAALIRGVNQIEETAVAPTWREGFRLGWSNRTFRLWLLELIVGIIVGLGALVLLALAASPLLLLLTDTDAGRIIGIALTVVLGIVVILLLLAVALVLSVLKEFWAREILLGDRGIGDAIVLGAQHVRSRLRDVALMWLLLFAIGIGFSVVMIPIVLAVLALAGGLGGGLGWLVYRLTDAAPWAVALGLPIFILILLIPLSLVGGLYTVFTHNAWTLTYRDVIHRVTPPALVVDEPVV